MDKLQIKYWDIDKISQYKKNARKHSEENIEAIVASIEEFGFNDPIALWHGEIVEGHGRIIAAQRLGIDKIPVIILDHLTDEQRKAYALVHNKTTDLSGWNFDLLSSELKDIADIDMSQFGFEEDDIQESLDLDEETTKEKLDQHKICHCPKCGFSFEV